ncbi:MAG: DUF368 domain-containing protein [Candidatus Omnitrophota bacterium]|nr:DUF368 domain-containing protein [Candidatus Omnitrophota bacterium]
MKRAIRETVILFIKGGAIGVANIIPGVSGGTLAVVLGVYDRLIEAIAYFFKKPEKRKEYIFFLMKVFTGAACAVILLVNVMDFFLKEHFFETMFLFMGLILGGIPCVVTSHKDMKIRTSRILSFVLGMIIILGLSMLAKKYGGDVVPVLDVSLLNNKALLMIGVAGFLAGGAMIIPGISGSFILVLMGQYAVIISAVKCLAVKPLIFMAIGAGFGILVFSRVIEVCLEKITAITYYFILGMIVASFYKIFPGIPTDKIVVFYCLIMFVIGTGISFLLSKVSAR